MTTTSKTPYMPFPSDYGTLTESFRFDPSKYSTAAGAAKAFHKALCTLARDVFGVDPDLEIWIKNPAEALAHGYGMKAWWVCWESGPYNWGVNISLSGLHGKDWHTEPYWGFDVAFFED